MLNIVQRRLDGIISTKKTSYINRGKRSRSCKVQLRLQVTSFRRFIKQQKQRKEIEIEIKRWKTTSSWVY